jgi:hypothetical protein
MAPDNVLIWAMSLYRSPSTLRNYQLQSREFLEGLRSFGEGFRHLSVVTPTEPAPVPLESEAVDRLIASAAFDPDHVSDYLNLLSDGSLGADSLSKIGFSLTYSLFDSAQRSVVAFEDGGLWLRLQGSSAAQEPETTVTLEIARECASDADVQRLRALLHYCLKQWRCDLGGISVRRYEHVVKGNDRASYAGQWLFYLPFPNLAKCLPPDIRHEPFANGILIETTPHMPNANNPADVAAGRRVRDVLDEFGFINDATYAIEGWPPDAEETRYEQFISGAPVGRKYTVHCVNFDGYDPDRKVLLYAKLLRRLKRHPKEWGFRGWDGPVLNEAKRQVRAAAKAGGVPIEWHIGLEEPAHAVRQLLADHTDITDQQLRIIYTPFEEPLKS